MIKLAEAKLLFEKIDHYEKIIIAKHQRADWDAQGSALGLAYLIQNNWTNKTVYVPGERLDQNLDFLPDEQMSETFIQQALLITVDTGNSARIDFQQWNSTAEVVKFDHHIPVENYGTENIVDEHAMACAQMVTLWAKMLKLKVNILAAENLYKGIVTDSGRFLFNETNAETFMAAGFLMEAGFDFQRVNDELYVSTLKLRQWANFAFSKMQLSQQGVGYILISKTDYEGRELTYNQIKSALYTMSGIAEIKIWFTVIELTDEYKVSLRSRVYDVNSIAINYQGGGHKLASGAKLKAMADYAKLVSDLDQLIKRTDQERK